MKISKTNIFYLMAIIMLILIITTGFFSIPIGITICSIIGTIYGYNYKDKSILRWSIAALFFGIVSVIYTLILIWSM